MQRAAGARRGLVSWISGYAALDSATRLQVLQRDVVHRYAGERGPDALLDEFSRTRNAMATAFAVRTDIAQLVRRSDFADPGTTDHTAIQTMDTTVQDWLKQSLSLDSLQLKRITFDHSSGYTLERVARGESVHRVRSLSELKRRLHNGKRCYGFFHPSMEAEPLVFVHVGLTSQLARSLSALDVHKDDHAPSHAMFYSINSPHTALRGLDIASLLIKETAEALGASFPSLQTFSTLSPVPKFCAWMARGVCADGALLQELRAAVLAHFPQVHLPDDPSQALKALAAMLSGESVNWASNASFCEAIRQPLLQLGAHYIAVEKRAASSGVFPLDDVARFHLRNGAVFHALNWMGNPSRNGLTSSAGLMVNYLYDFTQVETNAARFGRKAEELPLSAEVKNLLRRSDQ